MITTFQPHPATQRRQRSKDDEFTLWLSDAGKAASERVTRSIVHYVTGVSERGQRRQRSKDDE